MVVSIPVRVAVLGMAGGAAAELAEALQLVDASCSAVAGEVQQRIEQHRAVAGREHEAVAVGPVGMRRIEFEELLHSTVATSAMPIGMPGWPLCAFSTASMASARMAFAMRRSAGSRGAGSGRSGWPAVSVALIGRIAEWTGRFPERHLAGRVIAASSCRRGALPVRSRAPRWGVAKW